MSIEKRSSQCFKGREDLINSMGTARRILRALRTFAFFSVRRAIDIKVFQTLVDCTNLPHPGHPANPGHPASDNSRQANP